MRLEWSAFAFADREEIFNYIEADSPQAAITVDERIQTQVERLIQFPESGRIGRILRVLHGAQIWPLAMPEEP